MDEDDEGSIGLLLCSTSHKLWVLASSYRLLVRLSTLTETRGVGMGESD